MKIPKSIRVLGRKFNIVCVDSIPFDAAVLGTCNGTERIITIATAVHNEPRTSVATTLLHEALHAALHVSGHSLAMTDVTEEALVSMLTYAIEEIMPQLGKMHEEDVN